MAAAQPRPQAGPPTDHEHRCERMSAPTSPGRLSLPSRPRRRRCDPHRGNGPTGHCCELILTAARACPNPYATPGIDRPFVLFCLTACCAPLALRTVSQRVQRKHTEKSLRERHERIHAMTVGIPASHRARCDHTTCWCSSSACAWHWHGTPAGWRRDSTLSRVRIAQASGRALLHRVLLQLPVSNLRRKFAKRPAQIMACSHTTCNPSARCRRVCCASTQRGGDVNSARARARQHHCVFDVVGHCSIHSTVPLLTWRLPGSNSW